MKKLNFVYSKSILGLMFFSLLVLFNQCKEPASLSALIISDGDQEVTSSLQTILENSGLFDADINKGKSPKFLEYDVVVLNIVQGEWSEEVKTDFTSYVKNGGGVVLLSNSGNAFADWSEYQKIAGLENTASVGKSNAAYDYQARNVDQDHPVTNGLNNIWLHNDDYLLYSTSSLSNTAEILTVAKADTTYGGDGSSMPVLFTVQYEQGRVFHATLGSNAASSNQCVGFITTIQRGAEWAATGVVSQEAPIDFPNSASTHTWVDYKPLNLDEILKKSMTYEVGKSKKFLSDFSMRIRNCDGKAESYAMFEDKILEFLESDATVDSKKYMCRELSWMGSQKSISALEKLVNDKDLSESASYALQRLRM